MEKVIGKFKLQKEIGTGTTSNVYLALDEFTGEKVAIKVTRQNVFAETEHSETCRKMFVNEAAFAGCLHHPHIVAVLDAGIQEDNMYIVMEYVAGNNLKAFCLPDRLLPINDVVEIIFKCCTAMDYAFKKGVIHRDIKPANIILHHDNNIKITDFGSALLNETEITKISQLVGSPAYIAPEMICGEQASCQSDIYALGVTMYQLLTGRLPFDSKNTNALLQQILHEQPIPIEKIRKNIPADFIKIINKSICRDKIYRYQDWLSFADDISNALNNAPDTSNELRDTTRFKLLKKLIFFESFSDAELWELINFSKWLNYPSNSCLIKEGSEDTTHFFILMTGSAKVTKKGTLLGVIKEGEPIGEMSYITRTTRTASVYTLTASIILRFKVTELQRASKNLQIVFSNKLLEIVTIRLQKTSELVIDVQESCKLLSKR